LNGYTIRCRADAAGNEPQAGVLIEGSGATVRNGAVRDCREGIFVAGDGRHRVIEMRALFSAGTGVRVASGRNEVRDTQVFFSGGDGFAIDGARNRVVGNAATGHDNFGFFVRARNSVMRNIASGNRDSGFVVVGDRSVVTRNRALGSNRGFAVTGRKNRFTRNEAEANGAGFTVDGSARNNVFSHNHASDNRTGFVVIGDGSRLTANRAESNDLDGILLISTVEGTSVRNGVAIGNGRTDLVDESPGCGTNVWRGNTFGTRSQGCIE